MLGFFIVFKGPALQTLSHHSVLNSKRTQETLPTDMEQECKVLVEEKADGDEKFVFCTKTNVAMLLLSLFLVGTATAVLLMKPGDNAAPPQQDGHLGELRHSLRQTDVRAAIHLDGRYDQSSGSVLWQLDADQSYVQGELKLENNEVVIPHSGPYFVYSQASYQLSCSSDAEDEDKQRLVRLSHMVERWSASYGDEEEREYRPILHSIRTACERHPQQGHWFSGVYVGAMFNLKKGDHLRVSLTNDPQILAQLEDGHGETFFGVFAL